MLNFRRTNLLFLLMLVTAIVFDFQSHTPWYVYLLLVLLYSLIVFYGVYFIQSQFFLPTIYHGAHDRKSVALSFDDGPTSQYTPLVLDILKENGIKAVFFCIGKHIKGNEPLLQRIIAEGHEVGNHSFSHATWFDLFPMNRMLEELKQTDQLIESVTGKQPLYFRPPYGVITPVLRDAVRASGHTIIGWNVRSYDTMINDKNKLMARLVRLTKPGSIILLHEHGKQTIETLPEFIRTLRAQGYTFEPLEQLTNTKAYA